jgi:hypothetical protein
MTGALSPPHKWFPWVLVNGQYDESVQDQITDSLLKYVCDNFKGSAKSKDCPQPGTIVAQAPKDVCMTRETAFLQ